MDTELNRRLEELRGRDLLRQLRVVEPAGPGVLTVDGQELLNFSSNDYLGLSNHPSVKAAAAAAVMKWGAGSGASRLVCGSLALHHQLEEALAEFKQTERALVFSAGYAAALGTITALVGPEDFVVIDKLAHASIVDGARLSGATLRVFRHNDVEDLDNILSWCRGRPSSGEPRQILVITESVFSMDGDYAPLAALVDLKEKHGAWLMVDEAHALGLFGEGRSGRVELEGLRGRVEVQMGTLGKALGASGGFIAGSSALIHYLVNRARSFVFSTAPAPAASGAALEAVRIVRSMEGAERLGALRLRVQELISRLPDLKKADGHCPILPLMVGDESRALELSAALRRQGVFIPAIRYPTVGRGKARLRITCSASHGPEAIEKLHRALEAARPPG